MTPEETDPATYARALRAGGVPSGPYAKGFPRALNEELPEAILVAATAPVAHNPYYLTKLAEAVFAYGRAEYDRGLEDALQNHFCNAEDE